MAKKTGFDVDDASVLRVIEGLRSVIRGATSKETLENVGTAAIDVVKERTQDSHRDSMEGAFAPYKPGYAASKGVGQTQVDLTLTGQMFNSITRQAQGGNSVRLFFTNAIAEAKAIKHHFGLEGMPERRFFAVGEEPAEIILFEKLIARAAQMRVNTLMGVFQ